MADLELLARLDAIEARLAALEAAPPKRDPCSTTAARIDLGPRLGPARAFGFTAHTEGDPHA